jgi:hypothetical protein
MQLSTRKLLLAGVSAATLSTNAVAAISPGQVEGVRGRQISYGERARVSLAVKRAHAAAEATGIGCAPGIAVLLTGAKKFYPSTSDNSLDVMTATALELTALGHGKLEVNPTSADVNNIAGGYVTSRYNATIANRSDATDEKDGAFRPDWAAGLPISQVHAAIRRCGL